MYSCKTMFEINYFQTKVNDWDKKKIILLNLMKQRKLNIEGTNYTTYDSFNEDIELSKNIKIIFKEEIDNLKNEIGFEEYDIDYAWFQEELNGMFHQVHNHGHGISCVCYLEFDPLYHTPLVFLSPYMDSIDGLHSKYIPEDVESGTIIFFPSNLLHYTIPNKSEKSRKIVSFNIKPQT